MNNNKVGARLFSLIVLSAAASGAPAQTGMTGVTGGSQPFDNTQPSLAVTQLLQAQGRFPWDAGSASGGTVGFVYGFGGNAPPNSIQAQGQVLNISQNVQLFVALGATTYGGNGTTTYGTPNLQGRVLVGQGAAPGSTTERFLGQEVGSYTTTLALPQLPAHSHLVPGIGVTGVAGQSEPFDNLQPSLPVQRLIAIDAPFPVGSSGSSSEARAAFLGQIATFAGPQLPVGWAVADGSLMPINEYPALYEVIGTTYGGNGVTTFALPDLRGRVSIGAGFAAGNNYPLGTYVGQEQTTLSASQMPLHVHSLPGAGQTSIAGLGLPVTNLQPSLALNYLVAYLGNFPSQAGFDQTVPTLGQIVEFAGNYAPVGWMFANGQLLAIAQNQALFAVLGITYGGDGVTTFALPDLRGRTPIGSGQSPIGLIPLGARNGSAQNTIFISNIPPHAHTLPEIPPAERADVDGDGKSDIVWRNTSTGETYVYPMNGTVILPTEGFLRTVPLAWSVVGMGDFDGDGKVDILWRNGATGQNYIYLMNGTTIGAEGYIRTIADPNWQVAGIGDFDGDKKDDILWRNSVTGENYIYPMDGLAIKGTEGYLRSAALAWQVAGTADFNGDGKADILWRNSATGENYLYPMNGTVILGTEGYVRTVADTNWQVKGVGDFDGDGRADILWRNSLTGENYLYCMNGTTILPSEGYIRTVSDTAWQVAAVGDYNGDGKSDILWRNTTTGENYLYPMNGTAILGAEGYVRTVVDQAWTVAR